MIGIFYFVAVIKKLMTAIFKKKTTFFVSILERAAKGLEKITVAVHTIKFYS